MTVEDVKKTIEQRAGVPASVLAGETVDDVIESARAVLDYKRQYEEQRPKETREQFAEWTRVLYGETLSDAKSAALDDIAEAARVDAGGYPMVRDGSISSDGMPDPRPAREQFASWFKDQAAFNPFQA